MPVQIPLRSADELGDVVMDAIRNALTQRFEGRQPTVDEVKSLIAEMDTAPIIQPMVTVWINPDDPTRLHVEYPPQLDQITGIPQEFYQVCFVARRIAEPRKAKGYRKHVRKMKAGGKRDR